MRWPPPHADPQASGNYRLRVVHLQTRNCSATARGLADDLYSIHAPLEMSLPTIFPGIEQRNRCTTITVLAAGLLTLELVATWAGQP